jgi:AraC-like DNA-binding protein
MSNDHFEISVQYLAPILNELEKRGYTLREVFAYAGLQLPANCDNPGSVVLPVLDFSTLYGRALALLEVETSERLDKRPSDKGRLEVMCCVAIACPDLRNAARQLSTLSRFSHPQDITIHLEEREDSARLILDFHRSSQDTASLLVAAASLIFLYQIFSWVIGSRIRLRELHLKSPEPKESISLLDLLDAPVIYEHDCDAMVFDADILDWPVIRTYADLQKIIDYIPFDIWYSGGVDLPMAGRIRNMFVSALHDNLPIPSTSSLCQIFHVSEATLRRRLRDENSSYSSIREESQKKFAEYMLRCTDEPISDIALRAGFGDDRAFRRAFQRWLDISPSRYRATNSVESPDKS